MRLPFRTTALVVTLAVAGFSACSSSSKAAASCAPVVHEALDSNLTHVLPGAPEPTYLTDPPTSGPHSPGVKPSGVLTSPLSRPSQVGALEAGVVLVQYRDPADVDALRPLAAGQTVVVPNPGLTERVVATSWLFKQTCTAVDVGTLRAFATDHAGHGPGSDG